MRTVLLLLCASLLSGCYGAVLYEANIVALDSTLPVIGAQLRRRCEASPSHMAWTYRWTHPNGDSSIGADLTIPRLRPEDFGTFTCVAEAPGNYRLVAYDVVRRGGPGGQRGRGGRGGGQRGGGGTNDLEGGRGGRGGLRPSLGLNGNNQGIRGGSVVQLRIRSVAGENLVVGGAVRRRCSVDRPGFSVVWTYPSGRQVLGEMLSLDGIDPRDQGVYICRATGLGVVLNGTFTLSFEQTGVGNGGRGSSEFARIRIVVLPEENFIFGGTVRRQCRVSEPGWTISWRYPDGRSVDTTYLYLNNLSQRDAGLYYCVARKGTAQLRISFRLAFQTGSEQAAGLQIMTLGSERPQLGGSLRRECRANGPGWTTSWLLPNGRSLPQPILFIDRLGAQHAGTYTCIAQKGGITLRRTFEVQLRSTTDTRQVASISLQTLEGENFVYGGTVRRQCVVSTPGWTIKWQHPNGKKVDSSYLWLNNLQESNSGTYWCIATKDGTKLRLSFKIGFQQPGRRYSGVKSVQITIAPRLTENLVLGGSLHRRCQATNGTWQVTWLDPRGRVISGNNLDLSGMRAAQLGRYKCVARALNGDEVIGQILIGSKAGSQLEVRTLSIMTLPSERLRIGGVVQRRCVAPAGWNVHWQLPNGGLQPGDTLRINDLSPAKAGAYLCVAEGPGNQLLKSSFRMILIPEETPEYTTLRIRALDGESFVIGGTVRKECVVNSADWDVHWVKPNGDRVNSRFLTVTGLRTSDSGRYECVGKDRKSSRRLRAWFSIRLEETRIQTAEINIRTLPGESLVTGGSLRRRCVVTKPGWTIYWTRPDGSRVDSDVLNIGNLTPSMSGRYICHARHPSTGGMMNSWFSVAIRSRQSFTNVDVNVLPGESLIVGGTIHRECVVTSPDWTVYWVKPDGSRVDSRYLRVNNVQRSNAGRYTCFAKNRNTQQTLNTWFTVSFRGGSGPVLRIQELPGESLVAGGKIRRRCAASTAGWTIVWTKPNGARVNGADLTVDNLRESDGGRYVCQAENAAGARMQSWFSFRIVQVATIQMDTLGDENLVVGGVFSKRCRMTQPGWRIRWELPNGSTVLSDRLRITNLSRRNYGKYWCIASNPTTGSTRRASFQLG